MSQHVGVANAVSKVSSPLLARLAAIPSRPYPANLKTFANCHESFSEAQYVDRWYKGKTLDQIKIEDVADSGENTAFLRVEAMAYYWPKLLAALYLYPVSDYADQTCDLVFQHWGTPETQSEDSIAYKLKWYLTPLELDLAYDVLEALPDKLPRGKWRYDRYRDIVQKVLTTREVCYVPRSRAHHYEMWDAQQKIWDEERQNALD